MGAKVQKRQKQNLQFTVDISLRGW